MVTTPNLALPYLEAAQAQKHVTHNEALTRLDAVIQIAVADRDLIAPPGSPAEGDRYLVATGASGAWAGQDGRIAAFQDGAWEFHTTRPGWLMWVVDEATLLVRNGTAWTAVGGGISSVNPISLVGVNATADTTNRLSVKSDAVLVSHDDLTPGTGDVRIVANKAAVARTATFLFQSNWSGRAEIGLAGDDDFRFKVSADGSAWNDAIVLDRTSGKATFPATPQIVQRDTTNTLAVGYTATANALGAIASGTLTPDPALGNLQHYTNNGAHTLAAPTASGDFTMMILVTNGAAAGTITVSGFDRASGDTLTTTNGHKFLLHITKLAGVKRLAREALQ